MLNLTQKLSGKKMQNTLLLSVLLALLSCTRSGLSASDCGDVKYTTINDPRRSTANTIGTLCDKNLIRDNEWYQFSSEAGGQIPTTPPSIYSCGTIIPIWMNGSHPTVEEGAVNRTACTNAYNSICFARLSFAIKVRNCSGFYIYQLKEPSECHSAYCAGSKKLNCTNARSEDYCLENRPPYITMPKRLYAFENNKLQLVINATDPEGYPLKYGYHQNTTFKNVSILTNNKKQNIIIPRTKSGVIVLKVIDTEDKERTHALEIVAVPTSCRITGTQEITNSITVSTKREDLSNYSCSCAEPFTGKFCENSPCDHFPCFPGLNCTISAGSYKCAKCPSRFKGDGKTCKILTSKDTVMVDGKFTIISGLKWHNDLSNEKSFLYKQTTTNIVTEIMEIYRNTEEFVYVVITDYSKGSVVVHFKIVFNKKINDPLRALRTPLTGKNLTLGSFQVLQNSVIETGAPTSKEDDDSYYGLSKAGFIVLICFVSLIALAALVVCAICIKKKNINIIILSTHGNGPSNTNGTACSSRKKPATRNQIMDLHSVGTSFSRAAV